ncbi:hypothetical protein OIV83_003899 [Microbotryomycetes sp. JL201]|nr:hypothetical protein OIV83_003899 [Microbotryomycetes sp. JL201]
MANETPRASKIVSQPPATLSRSSSARPSSSSTAAKPPYISTETGNHISRKAFIAGSQNIIIGGKTVIEPGAVVRGDLRRAQSTSSSSSSTQAGSSAGVVMSIGKYCMFREGCVIRPPCKTYKGTFSYYPMKIGDFVTIGQHSVVEAASLGTGVQVGKNCIIGPLAIIKDFAKIADNSVVGAGAIVPSMCEWAGSPARPVVRLPESTPELVEAQAKMQYAAFKPV